ncbi:MAG: hypothetical protein E7473_05250 [Ruminococcaceae bacterium]|nr:hypothetical protein [Oscillospiraceae bacterium]
MKKKLLSLILAITMIATLLPAMALSAGAADVGYTLTYDFGLSGNVATKTNVTTYDDYSETNGRWKYADKATGVGTVQTYISSHASTGQGAAVEIKAMDINQWAAFRIYVPVDGDYKATLKYTRRNASALCGIGHTYILDGDITDIEEALKTATPLSDNMTKYDTTANRPNQAHALNATAKNLKAGEYIIVFRVEQAGAEGGFYMYPQELTLTSGDGSLAAPMYGAAASIDKENITVGGVGANITVSGPMSDGSDIAAANITYSSDSDCVSVANGVVTGASVGTANITTYVNGVALNTVTVDVTESAPDYADYTFTYDFRSANLANGTDIGTVTYDKTKALWSWNSKSRDTLAVTSNGTGDGARIDARTSPGYWFALNINVPVGGKYKASLKRVQTDTNSGYGDIYLLPGNTKDIAVALGNATKINEEEINYYYNSYNGEAKDSDGIFVLDDDFDIEAGEYILVFMCSRVGGGTTGDGTIGAQGRMYPQVFTLEGDATNSAYAGVVTLTNDELKVEDTTIANANIWNTADGSSVSEDVTFASDSTAVSVNENTLAAVAVGKASISAYLDSDVPVSIIPADVTVVDSTDDSVTFGKGSNIDSKITVDGTIKRGDTVTLTAEDIEGYNFVGWKRGNAETGKFILGAPQKNFEYTVYSNAFITAIYEDANPTSAAGVEFWNKNGELVAEFSADEFVEFSELPTASLIGHRFIGWETADGEEFTLNTELKSGITRVVAKYTADAVGDYFYDEAITYNKTKSGFSSWLRDGRIVSYAEQYIYYVFNAPDVEESVADVPEDKKPLVVLDEGHDAYMIEFDDADYTIVEVGIIAGNGTPTVSSAPEKHIAQKIGSHGQFAVKLADDYANVRGYVIYLDGTDYKIVYSD